MTQLDLQPTHKTVQHYCDSLVKFDDLGVSHEGAVKSAFRSHSASTGKRQRQVSI